MLQKLRQCIVRRRAFCARDHGLERHDAGNRQQRDCVKAASPKMWGEIVYVRVCEGVRGK